MVLKQELAACVRQLKKRGKAHEEPYSIVVLFAVAELHAWLFAGESGQLRDAEGSRSCARY